MDRIKKTSIVLNLILFMCLFIQLPFIISYPLLATYLTTIMYIIFIILQFLSFKRNKIWSCYTIGYIYGFIAVLNLAFLIKEYNDFSIFDAVNIIRTIVFCSLIILVNIYREMLETQKRSTK